MLLFLMKRLLFVVLYNQKYSPILHMCQKDPWDWSHAELHSPTLFRYLGGQLLRWHLIVAKFSVWPTGARYDEPLLAQQRKRSNNRFYLQLLLQPWAWFTRFMVDNHFSEMLEWIPTMPSNTDQYNWSRMFQEGPGENVNQKYAV